jgi:hypothetical protein
MHISAGATNLTRRMVDSCVVLPVPLLSLLKRSICSCWRSGSDFERFMTLILLPAHKGQDSAWFADESLAYTTKG